MSTSVTKSSHSAESSGYSTLSSENSATQITQKITSLKLSRRESESPNEVSPQADIYYSRVQHPTRRSERLQDNLNNRSGINANYHGGAFDPDVGPPRKRLKGNIPEPDYHDIDEQQDVVTANRRIKGQGTQRIRQIGNPLPVATLGTSNRTIERLERDREDWSRSPNIFSENRKLAVVIDNRSRSTSTSTNGRKGHQKTNNGLQTPTVKDPQETPVFSSRTRYQASLRNQSLPTSYQDNQPIVIDSDDDEILSLPQRTSQIFPPGIRNSQEFEEELTDAPMSLDSTEAYSPLLQEQVILDCLTHDSTTNATSGYAELPWKPHEGSRASVDPEGLPVQPDSCAKPPSVENPYPKDTNGHDTGPAYREPSSPPYSPPPPDSPETPPELVNPAESCASPPQTTTQDDRLVPGGGFVCRMCIFYIEDNGQYKDKLWYGSNL